ncbi:MAG TPA: lamin tail domain-containing protein, partial [Clostridia bacterium]|nr:lamin tail domain-containing protein [Clostridia bacterium]
VVINEVLTHTGPASSDAIELYNPTSDDVSIAGWYLTDDFHVPRKYLFPTNALVPAGGYLVLYQSNTFGLGSNAFALSSSGDGVYLFSGSREGELTGYVHGFRFGALAESMTFGRYVNSTGEEHCPVQIVPTLGQPNAGPLVGPVVISEIYYHPPDIAYPGGTADNTEDEYIELHNFGNQPVSLFDMDYPTNTWRLRGSVSFQFPQGQILPPGGFALIVNFAPSDLNLSNQFAIKMGVPAGVPLFGPLHGKLDNGGATVELARPDKPHLPPEQDVGFVPYVTVDRIRYSDETPWPGAADGLGLSLQRIHESNYGDDPVNWQAASRTSGASYEPGSLPVIVQQPQGQTNTPSSDVEMSVQATGPNPLNFQWRFNGKWLTGATNPRLSLTNVQPAQSGTYTVLVWSSSGSVSSDPAELVIATPPQILGQPADVYVRIAPDPEANPVTNATFQVIASSSSPLHYQWYFKESIVPGATNSTLTIANVQKTDWGEYAVTIRNDKGIALSKPAWLYPLVRPMFIAQPLSQSGTPGSAITFSASVSGWPPPFTFEWWQDSTLLASNVQTQTESFCSLVAFAAVGERQYSVVVRNVANPAGLRSAPATLKTLADSDGDGIPDVWWMSYDLTNLANRYADPDGDGMLNWEEYVAGTDPTNANSVLRLNLSREGRDLTFSFDAVSNKTYTLQCSGTPEAMDWLKLADFVARSSSHMERLTNGIHTTNLFYRLVTPQQP